MIPLGILATAGAGGSAGAGSYELIETLNGTGSSATITFSSIPQTYKHLQIRFAATDVASSYGGLNVRVNGVTTSTYSRHSMWGNQSSLSVSTGGSQSYIRIHGAYAGVTTSPTVGIVDIANYTSSAVNKTIRSFVGTRGDYGEVSLCSGFLPSTTAITSVTMFIDFGLYSSATRFSLYGIKG
jgi:hypothetical protein